MKILLTIAVDVDVHDSATVTEVAEAITRELAEGTASTLGLRTKEGNEMLIAGQDVLVQGVELIECEPDPR